MISTYGNRLASVKNTGKGRMGYATNKTQRKLFGLLAVQHAAKLGRYPPSGSFVHPAPLSWLVRLVGCAGAGGMDRQSDRVDACDRMGSQMQQYT